MENGKIDYATQESMVGDAHLPLQGLEPVGGEPQMSDAWPVRRQTDGYHPSRKASPLIGWYQIILLGDRGTCVLTSPVLYLAVGQLGLEPVTY